MKKLTAGMLNGTKYIETVEYELNGETIGVDISPLRHSDAAKIQAILSKGLKVKANASGKTSAPNEVDVDMAAVTAGRYEAQLECCLLGTLDSFTKEEIDENWPSDLIAKVGDRVQLISGIGKPEEVEEFRNAVKKQ